MKTSKKEKKPVFALIVLGLAMLFAVTGCSVQEGNDLAEQETAVDIATPETESIPTLEPNNLTAKDGQYVNPEIYE